MHWPSECVVVIPCLNEAATIASLVKAVRRQLPNVIVVDDGSKDATSTLAEGAGAQVIRHGSARGKGAALRSGWHRAVERGFSWALSMDGDGQHDPGDLPAFLMAAGRGETDLIAGNRFAGVGRMPWVRRRVNYWMSRRLSAAAGVCLPDSQCGYRLMRLAAWSSLPIQTSHFEIESEVLLAFVAGGFAVEFVPVQSIYKGERSKIHPLRDTRRWFAWWRQTQGSRSRRNVKL
jgi:glycosyltransferase involved in cell wall biosynthesis